jgi:16S rRNA (cytosine967-C5)-methyltransferase
MPAAFSSQENHRAPAWRHMENRTLMLASIVIQSSGKQSPADAMLREVLKQERNLTPSEAARVTQLVYAYFRWLGWLPADLALSEKIQQAIRLAEDFAEQPGRFSDAELVQKAVPAWLKQELTLSADWVRALQSPPKLWLRARPGQGRALAEKLGSCRIAHPRLEETLEYLGTHDLFRTMEFHAGEFELQDLSSQAVALICAPKPGQTWWDGCAGEGGKTMHFSDLMHNKGLIWASDRAPWRLQKLKRRAARARVFNYRTVIWQGDKLPTRTQFDGVLIDAPCTGTGTWHRNPHARWTTIPQDVQELSAIQNRMLENAARAVKPGGKLVYAVCTLTRSETVEVAEQFERKISGFERLKIRNPLTDQISDEHLEFWPQQFGGNGMFVVAWRRTPTGS